MVDSEPSADRRAKPHNFLDGIVQRDIAAGKDGGQVVTRFPPEPNGYPHIGHVKAMSISFGLAQRYGGRFHLRFDDTNPEKESMEYVEAIQRDMQWLGFDWGDHMYFASDYFERLHGFALELIRAGKAYVCSLSEEAMREGRGTLTEAGTESPYSTRSVDENLELFRQMREGKFAEGEHVLRARIDMASPNMKMRDPVVYRIRHKPHYRLGNAWCIYPLYDFQHCLSDAIEGVTHSLCSLEFENNRELYDWFVANVSAGHVPRQYEFARLNITHTVTGKRVLRSLVETGHVQGWDDPRMPTVSGMRRRGYPPEALRDFCERVGVARNQSTAELSLLEYCVREQLNRTAPRVLCVLRPLKLTIESYPEDRAERWSAPHFPADVGLPGEREISFSRDLYIEREDFSLDPPKRWHRLAPGAEVRLRYAYIVRCTEVIKDKAGHVVEVRAVHDPASRSDGGSKRTAKGTIHWVDARTAVPCRVRLYDRLFSHPDPAAVDGDIASALNPKSLETVSSKVEASVAGAPPGTRYQFERQGFFCADPETTANEPLFNQTVALKDSWAKRGPAHNRPLPDAPSRSSAGTSASPQRARKARSATKRGDAPDGAPMVLSEAARALAARYGLTEESARLLSTEANLTAFFEDAAGAHPAPQNIANFMTLELLRAVKETPLEQLPFGGAAIGRLVGLVDAGSISLGAAKAVFAEMLTEGGDPEVIVDRRGLGRVSDAAQLEAWVDEVLARFPEHVEKYRKGQLGLLGALVGQVMRLSGGRADAPNVKRLLSARLAPESQSD